MPAHPDLAAWADRLAAVDLPVLRASALALSARARRPDEADAHTLAAIALRDPLLSLRVLRSAGRRQSHRGTQMESVTAALVLTGIDPFFSECAGLPVLEDALDSQGRAAVHGIVQHARAAARIAAAFAIHRGEADVEAVHLAALLHDCAALLLWYAAPGEAPADLPLAELGAALLERWEIADNLRRLAGPPQGDAPGPRIVALATRLADRGAPAKDLEEAAQLLHLQPAGVAALVRQALT